MKCPFCQEDDFDNTGLKHHLLNYCVPFAETPSITEERRNRILEDAVADAHGWRAKPVFS